MKKVLLCAGVLALAVSCSENDYDSTSLQNNSTGIKFVSIVDEPTTREEMAVVDGNHYPFWYAEQDEISILSINTAKGNIYNTSIVETWANAVAGGGHGATYKATKSQRDGEFTAANTSEILWFNQETTGVKTGAFITVSPVIAPADVSGVLTYASPITSAQTQTGNNGQGVFANMFQIGFATGALNNPYDAVGETVNLAMKRQNVTVIFNVEGVDEYVEDFGNLKTITLDGGTKTLVTTGATFEVTPETDLDKFGDSKVEFVTNGGGVTTSASIELTLKDANGLAWSDDSYAYMATDPVSRTEEEELTATYKFAHIEFGLPIKATSSWKAGDVKGLITLDINSYDYLVTNESVSGSSNDRTLIINRGTLSDILKEGKIIWPIPAEGEEPEPTDLVPFSEFKVIRITPELSTADLAKLNGFTNAETIVLKGNTTIPTGTFADLDGLKEINFPEVTTIGAGAFSDDTSFGLTDVILPKFVFNNAPAKDDLLKSGKLVNLDMSAVTEMGDMFPAAGFTLSGFTHLTTVTVGENLVLGGSAFNGCTSLVQVIGGPVTIQGSNVFYDCKLGNGTDVPKELKVKLNDEGIVPAGTFYNCKLEEILDATGATLAPIKVMANAFKSCTALKTIDLANTTELGESAFYGCTVLKGENEYKGKLVLEVGATIIPVSAFQNCARLDFVYFSKATKIEANILDGADALKEVKFKEPFTGQGGTGNNAVTGSEFKTDGTTSSNGVILYINGGQKDITGNSWKASTSITIKFANIVVE